MGLENGKKTETERKPHAYIEFGGSGHETEYVFTLQPNMYGEAQDLPSVWEHELLSTLGEDWSIMNRGHRIEIVPPDLKRTSEADTKLLEAIKKVVKNDDCIFIIKD